MPEHATAPLYRYRGNVKPSAEIKRPARAYRHDAATENGNVGSTEGGKSATLDIFDVIDSWGGWWGISAGEVDAALAQVGEIDTLYVRVNSPGGEATEGIAIANLLRAHAATIHVTVYGLAASAASYISTAGDTVAMAPGSMMMIHDAWNLVAGDAADLRAEADVLDTLSNSIASLYALKAGGKLDAWRALMVAETWYGAQDAVDSGLADRIGIDVAPAPVPVPDDADKTPDIEVDVTVEITPAARAACRFDLSVFRHVPDALAAAAASLTPAQPPEKHPPTEEAVTMTETALKALRERLGLAEDADEAAINAKLDELQAAKPSDTPADPVAALAKDKGLTPEQINAALDGAAKGHVTVSQVKLDELEANASLGVEARKQQLGEARDAAIEAAFTAGKISADRRDAWRTAWDKDPEGTKTDLDSLEARFPVASRATGYAGSDATDGDGTKPFNDDEATALATLAGVSKEALTHG